MARYQVTIDGVTVFETDRRALAAHLIDAVICPNIYSGTVDLREGNHILQSWSFIGINPRGQSMWRDSVAPQVYVSMQDESTFTTSKTPRRATSGR